MKVVPIVVTSPLDRMFEGLPVLILQSWTEVNVSRLAAEHRRFAGTDWPAVHAKIAMSTWVDDIIAKLKT